MLIHRIPTKTSSNVKLSVKAHAGRLRNSKVICPDSFYSSENYPFLLTLRFDIKHFFSTHYYSNPYNKLT
ncbi:hypothetical protein HZS_2313 [Henneguya salminicola]|nr:hypothetical protein HZS_2313 [Henneguya salminicola]